MSYYVGVDIGGTFTDCVIMDEAGRVTLAKASSTPPDFSRGFLDAVAEGARCLGRELGELLSQTNLLLHGTTVGTNILVQMLGAKTGLITTRGHRDALIMMRSAGRSAGLPIEKLLHVSRHRKPDPIVPPTRIKEVSERVDWEGDVILPLNEEEARQAIEELVADGVESIAISFLWGFVNTEHERRVKRMVEEMAPGIFVTCAHELIGKPGEYERTAGAAINAFIGPTSSTYLKEVSTAVAEGGYANPLLIMQAFGGVVPAEEAAVKPLFTINSGPVGGITGAAYLASLLGHKNVIGCDMGGTSFDVGIIVNGEPQTSSETIINQYTFFMPRLDIESIGSGGGSLLWIDEHSGTLRVGPESAGASPGPACYGRGGERATVTDCNLFLRRYNPEGLLAGKVKLDYHAAQRAVEDVAKQLGLDATIVADGALRIVEAQMAGLMRQMTLEGGRDPRDFVVYAFGGAGAAHAVAFARELGCKQVVIPLGDLASTFSALGVMSSDVLHVFEYSELMQAPFDAARLNEIYGDLEAKARAQLEREGFSGADIELSRIAMMKFSLQIHQVEVSVPAGELAQVDADAQVERFIERYEQIYGGGSAFPDAGTQIGLFRVLARGKLRTPALPEVAPAEAVSGATREVYWRELRGFQPTEVYNGEELGAGATLAGPAIVDFLDTTVVVPPGATALIDVLGNVVIDVGAAPAGSGAVDVAVAAAR